MRDAMRGFTLIEVLIIIAVIVIIAVIAVSASLQASKGSYNGPVTIRQGAQTWVAEKITKLSDGCIWFEQPAGEVTVCGTYSIEGR